MERNGGIMAIEETAVAEACADVDEVAEEVEVVEELEAVQTVSLSREQYQKMRNLPLGILSEFYRGVPGQQERTGSAVEDSWHESVTAHLNSRIPATDSNERYRG